MRITLLFSTFLCFVICSNVLPKTGWFITPRVTFETINDLNVGPANARKMIERLPEDKLDYQPHKKSYSMKQLATHVANLLSWVGVTLKQDSLDLSQPFEVPKPQTRDEILELFDKLKEDARIEIENSGDEVFMENWTLKNGKEEIFTIPKMAVLRSFVMNHIIHHRAQLGVY